MSELDLCGNTANDCRHSGGCGEAAGNCSDQFSGFDPAEARVIADDCRVMARNGVRLDVVVLGNILGVFEPCTSPVFHSRTWHAIANLAEGIADQGKPQQ